jgi:hypothetical protein
MVERQMDPRFDFVDDKMVREILADSPVLFPRTLVIDPTAPRRLEERVDQQQQELAIGSEHSSDFVDRLLEPIYVLNGEAENHRVKRDTGKGKLFRRRLHEARPATRVRLPNLGTCRVQSDHFSPAPGDAPGDLSLATSHIEHSARSAQMLLDQRKYLFFVFGIGSGGEPPLPPQ